MVLHQQAHVYTPHTHSTGAAAVSLPAPPRCRVLVAPTTPATSASTRCRCPGVTAAARRVIHSCGVVPRRHRSSGAWPRSLRWRQSAPAASSRAITCWEGWGGGVRQASVHKEGEGPGKDEGVQQEPVTQCIWGGGVYSATQTYTSSSCCCCCPLNNSPSCSPFLCTSCCCAAARIPCVVTHPVPTSVCPAAAARCRGRLPRSPMAFTSPPADSSSCTTPARGAHTPPQAQPQQHSSVSKGCMYYVMYMLMPLGVSNRQPADALRSRCFSVISYSSRVGS